MDKTSNREYSKPAINSKGWGVLLNENFDKIDSDMVNHDHNQIGAGLDHAQLAGITPDDHHTRQHGLGGTDHVGASLAELNALISDATLDDSSAVRTPAAHGNEVHNGAYIEASGVTFENLNVNGDVGAGASQVASGDHSHTGFTPAGGTTGQALVKASESDFDTEWTTIGGGEIAYGDEPGIVSSADSGSGGTADTASRSDHSHDLGAHAHTGAADGGAIAHSSLLGTTANDHHNQQHALGGADHTTATLAELNAKISDAALDDTGSTRPPQSHGNEAHTASYLTGLDSQPIDMGDQLLTRPEIKDYSESFQTVNSSSGTVTVDLENGNNVGLTLSEDVTSMSFTNPPAGGRMGGFTLFLTQDATGRSITWPASVKWSEGAAPDISTVSVDYILVFVTHDGGTAWYGFLAGNAMA